MGITVTTGIASGIDYEAIIEASMEVKEEEIEKYETKLEDYETEISALGEVKSALSTLQDAIDEISDSWDFYDYTATSSDEDVLTATATDDAAAGSHQIEVTQLATSSMTIGGELTSDTDAALGVSGSFSINGGTDITIESTDSLSDIVDKINDASGDEEGGATASLVQVSSDGGYRIALTSNEAGAASEITLTSSDTILDDLMLSTGNTYAETSGQDAQIEYNGVTYTRDSNEFENVIAGVVFSVSDEGSVTLNVATDTEGMTEKVQAVVDAYNSFIELLDEYQDEGDEESYGILFGDNTTNNLRAKLRNVLFSEVENEDSNLTYLSRLGVEMGDDGLLTLDTSTLEEALAEDAEGVKSFFTTQDTGFGDLLSDAIDGYIAWDGILEAKIDGLESSAERTEEKIESLEDKLDLYEERLTAEYAALESLLSELTSTQESLTSLLESLDSSS